jgi:hypothetical protein
MRVRKLTASGDFSFGQGRQDFFVDQPEAVAQIVKTRLSLWLGDWFLDVTDGMDWQGSVLGNRTRTTRDPTLRRRVLESPSVTQINDYSSGFDGDTRAFRASFGLDTEFGVYGQFAYQYVTPSLIPAPELEAPLPPPIIIDIVQTSDRSIFVSWGDRPPFLGARFALSAGPVHVTPPFVAVGSSITITRGLVSSTFPGQGTLTGRSFTLSAGSVAVTASPWSSAWSTDFGVLTFSPWSTDYSSAFGL